ncbi:NAD(P)-dependent dehydrogenase (short-subunit alcohol dehydrogenase family) [Pseudomonas sp. JAI111]|jgi:NAD(P)-dependent dehydrogenase (short-subunit alcohol dehydrogenase family)|uniref:SDR family NAD(P)-dependent oxidoreductase n=1 Tax=unclassified Pseudomonas TaxID=196821 RepID=UPI0021693B70|nr:SDR family NAD(P)-dependent oxidoreductase [Pseudomonas sp. JAI111]MCS3841636.1 NAD(P)-dependent dehydrogenase (short-subunit alcohol dehydrogenase family) [Pseudomonas sp. JAI111]
MTDLMQPFSMTGKTVLVADAATRLGAHFARLISAAGARVALGTQHPSQLEQLAADLRWDGADVMIVALDSARRQSIEAALDAVQARMGSVDVLINNSAEREHTALNNHIVHCTSLHMIRAERGGSIVNIDPPPRPISEPNPCLRPNSSLIRMSRAMAQSLTPHRIRVNVIAPGQGQGAGLQELNGPLLLLASGAGASVTGAVLHVDGPDRSCHAT